MDLYQPPAQFPNPSENIHLISQQELQARYSQFPSENNHQSIPIHQQQQQQTQIQIINENHQQNDVQPSQYALLRVDPDVPNANSRILLKKKIRDIDTRLGKGWFYLYKLWLGGINFLSGFMTGYAGMAFVYSLIYDNSYSLPYNYYVLLAVISGIWLIQQCLFEGNAIERRDLVDAKKALNSMYLFVVFSVMFGVGIFVFIERTTFNDQNWFQKDYWSHVVGYVILMSIQIGGATKVKKLLEKRDALDFELFIRYPNNS